MRRWTPQLVRHWGDTGGTLGPATVDVLPSEMPWDEIGPARAPRHASTLPRYRGHPHPSRMPTRPRASSALWARGALSSQDPGVDQG